MAVPTRSLLLLLCFSSIRLHMRELAAARELCWSDSSKLTHPRLSVILLCCLTGRRSGGRSRSAARKISVASLNLTSSCEWVCTRFFFLKFSAHSSPPHAFLSGPAPHFLQFFFSLLNFISSPRLCPLNPKAFPLPLFFFLSLPCARCPARSIHPSSLLFDRACVLFLSR